MAPGTLLPPPRSRTPADGGPPSPRSHDFIGEFTTSYRELARGQSQFNVYEVRPDSEDGDPRGQGEGRSSCTHGCYSPSAAPLGLMVPMLHP